MTPIRKVEDIGYCVHRARKILGLTQEQLAATSGVGVGYLRELEQGKESCHIGKALMDLSMMGLTLSFMVLVKKAMRKVFTQDVVSVTQRVGVKRELNAHTPCHC